MEKKSPAHIGHPDFQDRNISPLDHHPRKGKILKSPFSRLDGTLQLSSWYDRCIPNVLWACIVASQLERSAYLNLFRRVLVGAREKLECRKRTFVTHNFLATLSDEEFDSLLSPMLADEQARAALSAISLVDCLPDIAHWRRHCSVSEPEKAWSILAGAVFETFDHQSEKTTDIRWFKLMYLIIVSEKLFFDEKFASRLEEFRVYPEKGDMRSVRPSIRAMELSTRTIEFGEEELGDAAENPRLPPDHGEAFWLEMKSKTQCSPVGDFSEPIAGPRELIDEALTIYMALDEHFHATTATTAPDPRHDGGFGFVLYALSVLMGCSARLHAQPRRGTDGAPHHHGELHYPSLPDEA